MATDLQMLVYSCLLMMAQSFSVLLPALLKAGLAYGLRKPR